MADRQAGLTGQELAVMDLTAQLANALAEIVGDGPSRDGDLAELCGHLHGIQRAVMAQAAARRYPQRFRLLGSTVGLDQEPPSCGPNTSTSPAVTHLPRQLTAHTPGGI